MMVTKEAFDAMRRWQRGYAVSWLGSRDDEPNVPAEGNPYAPGSHEYEEWDKGHHQAMLEKLDYDGRTYEM